MPKPLTVFFSPEYNALSHAFDTTRKATHVAAMLDATKPKELFNVVRPVPLTRDELLLAHDPAYIDAIQYGGHSLSSSSGFEWCHNTYKAVCSSNGGVLAACKTAFNEGICGTLSSGLHHANYWRGGGFCTFNGLAVAAIYMIKRELAESVLILDLDAHYGDGTAEIIRPYENITQLDISTGDLPEGPDVGEYYIEQVRGLLKSADLPSYDLCLYNAGMDPHEGCCIGGRRGITDDHLRRRDMLVFQSLALYGVPTAFTLAGGYHSSRLTEKQLAKLHYGTCVEAYHAAQHFVHYRLDDFAKTSEN